MISFYATPIENRHATQNQLAVISATGGKASILTASFDRDISGHAWSADSKTIYFVPNRRRCCFSVPAKGGTVSKIFGNDNGINDFDLQGDKVVYALTETKNPWEVHLLNLKDKSTRQVTRLNEEWLKDK
ncbi:MAG: hypothetical protein U5K54_11335 [Cytophagales bacterium]|nr:hypothetical protein [Cytophagales bacterium]